MSRLSLDEAKRLFSLNGFKVYKFGSRYCVRVSRTNEWVVGLQEVTGRELVAYARECWCQPVATVRNAVVRFNPERTFGVELECYHKTNRNIINDAIEILRANGIAVRDFSGYTHTVSNEWHITTDSSLNGGYTMEVVSPVLKGQEGIDEVKKVVDILDNTLGCRVNRSCGTHVHQGANDFRSDDLERAFKNYKNNEHLFDSLVPASRRGDARWCHTLEDVGYNSWGSTRYVKLNKCSYVKYGTLEYRQHSGTLNGDKLDHWIKLTNCMMELAKRQEKTFSSVEEMCDFFNLDTPWYLERVEDLAM